MVPVAAGRRALDGSAAACGALGRRSPRVLPVPTDQAFLVFLGAKTRSRRGCATYLQAGAPSFPKCAQKGVCADGHQRSTALDFWLFWVQNRLLVAFWRVNLHISATSFPERTEKGKSPSKGKSASTGKSGSTSTSSATNGRHFGSTIQAIAAPGLSRAAERLPTDYQEGSGMLWAK